VKTLERAKMRTILVGISPGNASDEPLSPIGASGRLLAKLLGVSSKEYIAQFDRINILHSATDGVKPAVKNLLPILRGRRVVALGSQVRRALDLPESWFDWNINRGFVGTSMPHPSGRNRWWNDHSNREQAKTFMQTLNLPCIHVEGADGAGKSHLVKQLMNYTEMSCVPTEDPPKSWGECLFRVKQRIHSGVICDRSSGLVSELVYGPVLRGKTIAPAKQIWGLLESLIHAVTFVFCRPSVFNPAHRKGESEEHTGKVEQKHKQLVQRYDEVFAKMSQMGARIIPYNWTTQPFDHVVSQIRLPSRHGVNYVWSSRHLRETSCL
jgi:thymidylate kinase